jgi:hypothetical protein
MAMKGVAGSRLLTSLISSHFAVGDSHWDQSEVLFSSLPYFFQQSVQRRVVFLELGANKRIEVVPVEKGFGALREVFLVIGQTVVLHPFAGGEQHAFVGPGSFRFLVGGDDLRVVEAKELVVIRMGEFMKNHRGMLEHLLA